MNRLYLFILALILLNGCKAFDHVQAARELNQGLEMSKKGQYSEALNHLQKAMDFDPSYAEPAYYMGLIYHQSLKDSVKGSMNLETAFELAPENPQIAYALGSAYAENGKFDKAIAAFQKSVALKPDFARAWFRLGNAYRDNKEYRSAVDAYMSSIEADPQMLMFPDDVGGFAYSALADLYQDFDMNDKAIAVLKDGIRTNPNANRLRVGLGTAAIGMEQYDLAEQTLADALELEPQNGPALFNRGVALMNLGKPENAARSFREFIATGKGSPVENDAAQQLIAKIESGELKNEAN